jgi:probable biosynthetic protein (TIGR04098 family)
VPLSELRTLSGGEVYATFYFIEERFPAARPITAFGLDDRLHFGVFLRAFKNIAVEGRLVFERSERIGPMLDGVDQWPGDDQLEEYPWIRFGNIFITPEGGNSVLKVAPPANANFSRLPLLPNDENPYHLTRVAETSGELGLLDSGEWQPLESRTPELRYPIDPDRDTNGAGLVYSANYIAFMDAAERQAMRGCADRPFSSVEIAGRALLHRRVGFYGNVAVDDAVRTKVSLFAAASNQHRLGVRFTISRESDGRVICRSEAVKALPGEGA